MIIDTLVRHDLSDGAYAARRRSCEQASLALGVPDLRHASNEMLASSKLEPELLEPARHVVGEIGRVRLAAAALMTGDLETFGELMFASHASLRDDFKVSCKHLDFLVDCADAMRSSGILGARMTGGGFGGCVVALCRTDDTDTISKEFASRFEQEFEHAPPVYITPAVGGAAIVDQIPT